MQAWWARLGNPERMMLLAVGLSILALLFHSGSATHYYLNNATNLDYYTGMNSSREPGTGWELRGMRGLVLPLLLGVVFALGMSNSRSVRGWIFWLAGVLLIVATLPSSIATLGGLLAYGAIGLTFWTAWKVGKAMKAERAAAPPPPAS